MVASEYRTGLYITVPVYFTLLGGAAYWAYKRMERMKHDHVDEKLAAHYLGGRDFGPLLTAGTLFASLFSGYTVIGVPNQAYNTGWTSVQWIPNLMGVVIGYYGTGMRLLKNSMVRNHQSPVDFLTDRYQSQVLRYTIVFLQVLPTEIYLSAQVISIKSTFNSIFELDPDSTYPVIIIMALILVFEWVGGLSSVALTDSIQAIVMVLSFIIIPSVIAKNWGGWSSLDPETYPIPEYYQTPTKQAQWSFYQFSLINFSFFTLPHLLQRTYAAKNPESLKMGYTIMTIGPWLTTFVGIFMGTVGISMLQDEDGNATEPDSPFTAILEQLMELGGFPLAAGVVAVTASLAAIMSTADSLIIAISQLITMEIVYPIRPHTSPNEISLIGKGVSLCAVTVAMLIGIFWDEGVADMGAIQFSISFQAIVPFLFGLFATSKKTDCHPWVLTAGALGSTFFVVGIYFGYLKPDNDSLPLVAGIIGFLVQLGIVFILEGGRRLVGGAAALEDTPHMMMKGDEQVQVLYADRPEWDVPYLKRFGEECLTPKLVWGMMEGINEPMASPWWCFLMFTTMSISTPWTPGAEPPLAEPGGESKYLYPPSVVNGMPWWCFKAIVMGIFITALLLMGISNIPNSFPEDNLPNHKLDGSGVEKTSVGEDVEEEGHKMKRAQTGSISDDNEEQEA